MEDQFVLDEIRSFWFDGSHMDLHRLYRLIEHVRQMGAPHSAIEELFALIVRNPDGDFGAPGPVVSFLESYWEQGYGEALIASVRRHPTEVNLRMLNRAAGRTHDDAFLRELQRVASEEPAETSAVALEYLDTSDE